MPGPDGKSIMHAEIKIGPSLFFVNDEFPGMSSQSPLSLKGTSVTLTPFAAARRFQKSSM